MNQFKLYPDALLVTKPLFNIGDFSKFFDCHTGLKPIESIHPSEFTKPNHCDLIPMMAGKTCYLSFDNYSEGKGRNNTREHIGNLINCSHGSVLEHTGIGFILMTSRDISHEIVRHRAGMSYSQLSQRYVDKVQFLIPPELHPFIIHYDNDNKDRSIFESTLVDASIISGMLEQRLIFYEKIGPLSSFINSCKASAITYEVIASQLQDVIDPSIKKTEARKIVNQTARSVLPNATVTYIFATGNIRAWRTVCEQRCSKHASTGIRSLFNRVFDQLCEAAPSCFQDYTKNHLNDKTFEILTNNKKI